MTENSRPSFENKFKPLVFFLGFRLVGRLRRALFTPALAGVRFDPHMKAFYTLLQQRQKSKMQALMAVARKLLHAIYGIFKTVLLT